MNNPRLLLLLLAAVGLVAVYQWQDGGLWGLQPGSDATTTPPPPADAGTPPGSGTAAANPLHDLTSAQLAEIATRPLFNPTRAPRPAPEPTIVTPEPTDTTPTPAAPEVNPADYQLLAIASSDMGRVAVVRFAPENRIYHLRQGQYLSDWLVEDVGDRSVKLSHADKNFEIAMFQPGTGAASSGGGDVVAPDAGDAQTPPDAVQDGGGGDAPQ